MSPCDFRNLNNKHKHKPYPITKINEMLLKLQGFQYDTVDLNLRYYNIRLTENTIN